MPRWIRGWPTLLCVFATAAAAEVLEGRTSCGAYRFDARANGEFTGEVCDRSLKVEGTHSGAAFTPTRVRMTGLPKPVDLRRLRVPPFDARSATSVERWVGPFDALRMAETLMREAAPEGGFSGSLGEAASLVTGIGGDIGCTDAENTTGGVVDIESSITTDNFYVPAWCTVIVHGPVHVKSLRVDGVLIRSFGAIRADTVQTGTLTGGVFGGYIAAFGVERSRQVQGAVSAVDSLLGGGDVVPGPGLLEAKEVHLQGGGVFVDEARLQSLRVNAASFTARNELRTPTLVTEAGGRVTAGSLATDRAVANGGSIQARERWTGMGADGDAVLEGGGHSAGELRLLRVTLRDTSLTVTGPLVTPVLDGTGATITAQDAEIAQLTLRARSSLTARGAASAPAASAGLVSLTDSALSAGTIRYAQIQAASSAIAARGVLETQRLTGTDTRVEAGEQLRAREGAALVQLERGSVSVDGTAVTGEPGFEGCSKHTPQIDVGRLEVRGGPVDATHVRADTLLLRGGHLWPKNPETIAVCLEISERTDVDGIASEPFLKAPRLYASLGQATVGKNAELVISASGTAATTAPQKYPDVTDEHRSGASFGGFGGTSADLNVNKLDPAEDPGTRAELGATKDAREFREGGIGGWGKRGGTGGGTIRIRGSALVFDGAARANGSDGLRGGSGGTGGTIHVELTGALSGAGLLQVNGGGGGFGDPGSLSAGGGSGGRIRIDCETKKAWRGRTETLGGLGASLAAGNDEVKRVPAWDDWRNHGGPGTVYWQLASAPDELVIEGVLDGEHHRGVGFLTGDYPDAEVIVRKAIVATDGFSAGALSILDGGRVVPNNPRVRLPVPPQAAFLRAKPAGMQGLRTSQIILPSAVEADRFNEKVTLSLSGNVRIDRTSSLDVSRFGGEYGEEYVYSGGVTNRAGGSHGGFGGVGRGGEPRALGRPALPELTDVLEPTLPGQGGFGGAKPTPDRRPHHPMIRGGVGGAVLRLRVGGTVQVDGSIRADGDRGAYPTQDYHGHGSGGGAGGSIWITAAQLSGSGVISASGGDGSEHGRAALFGGGGGGGRLRFDLQDARGWTGKTIAHGGRGAALTEARAKELLAKEPRSVRAVPWSDARNDGGPGTIVWALAGRTPQLLIDGTGAPRGPALLNGDYPDHEVVIRGALVATTELSAKQLRLLNGARLVPMDQRSLMHPRGILKQWLPLALWNGTQATAVQLSFSEGVQIDAKSAIDVSGAGEYPSADEHCSRGAFMNMAGGSHGAPGGTGRGREKKYVGCAAPALGSVERPTTAGAGGYGAESGQGVKEWNACLTGGSGGAAIKLTATKVQMDGKLLADGVAPAAPGDCKDSAGNGGGAGGSIWIVARTLEGRGLVSAAGGAGQRHSGGPFSSYGGGGSGGRVHLEVDRCAFRGAIRVDGGPGGSGDGISPKEFMGQRGTIAGSCRAK